MYWWFCRVSDEKDARGYLQALATKMTEELENLKVMGVSDDSVSLHSNATFIYGLMTPIMWAPLDIQKP